jgi:hypothetical protein
MSEYTPDSWVILEVSQNNIKTKKVFAGWRGGYLSGDEWRLSSGITVIVDSGDHYDFHNESGSVYHCRKIAQGFTGLMGDLYDSWEAEAQLTEDIEIKHVTYGETK